MNGHRLQRITVQPVAIVLHPSSDEPVMLSIGEERSAIGCEDCNMNLEEAMEKPCTVARLARDRG